MSLVAWKEPYLLQVMLDDEPENPRDEEDTFGCMVCWHRRYNLGEQHSFDTPNDFLKDLVLRTVPGNTFFDYVRSGQSHAVRLTSIPTTLKGEGQANRAIVGVKSPEQPGSEWKVEGYDTCTKEWYEEETVCGGLEEQKEEIMDCLIDILPNHDLLALAGKENIILPLFLYDHSGLSISASSFVGREVHAEWDSGQVGWIYATAGEVKETYGSVSTENMEKAKQCLLSGVKTYDAFLSGQCYGFRLYKDGEEIQAGSGYFGFLPDIVKELAADFLPESHKDMVENLKEIPDVRTYALGYEDFMEELGYTESEEMEGIR